MSEQKFDRIWNGWLKVQFLAWLHGAVGQIFCQRLATIEETHCSNVVRLLCNSLNRCIAIYIIVKI